MTSRYRGVKRHRLTLLAVSKFTCYGLFSPRAAVPCFWGPVQSPFINVLNNYHPCGKGIEYFSVWFMASTKYCATECLLPVITATLLLTALISGLQNWTGQNIIWWCWQDAKGFLQAEWAVCFSPVHLWPRTYFVVCGCHDKDTANTFPPVVGLEDPVAMLGAVHGKRSLRKSEASAVSIAASSCSSGPKGNPPEGMWYPVPLFLWREGSGGFPGGMNLSLVLACLTSLPCGKMLLLPLFGRLLTLLHPQTSSTFSRNYGLMLGWHLPARSCFPVSLTYSWHVELRWYFLNVWCDLIVYFHCHGGSALLVWQLP